MNREPRQIRSCVACRRKGPRSSLVRFVADDRGHPRPDPAQRLDGRGVYTCAAPDCVELAASRGGFARGLRRRVAKVDPAALAADVGRRVCEELDGLLDQGRRDGRVAGTGADLAGLDDRKVVEWSGRVVKDPRLRQRVAALAGQAARLGVLPPAANGEVRVR